MLPPKSFLTGEKATEPRTSRTPKRLDWSLWGSIVTSRASNTEDSGEGLGSVEKLGGGNGVVGTDRDISEGLLEGLHNCATGGDLDGHNDGYK